MKLLPVHMCVYEASTPDDTILLCGAKSKYHGPDNIGNGLLMRYFLSFKLKDYEEWCTDCQEHPNFGLYVLAEMELE